ncbi:tRNA pseudouridine(13) synthase TruD [Limnoglobus roseus]|uniref:tRNA pseudouridine(13) synthase TruD n=1 Tax=Limnoglobus roseus TaxID=2598579 RepID=A0A5C1AEP3_9BACT|nr:tRNA pseudouridine(13) synthase TruD [Limnoglobus roseus]QEL17879.1 tRNA pseudouridine(13) synthase TruD [Limnoglobus roseus]
MKIKQLPEDFIVEEVTSVTPSGGPFAYYRLDKIGWTTPDALNAVRRRWDIDGRRLSYGGLKDRHAKTSQHFTIYHGPTRNLQHERVTVTYLGPVAEPFTAQQIGANRFTITMRAIAAGQVPGIRAAIDEVHASGLPNYFDDQRFGSVGSSQEFVAKEMVRGNFEAALKLALASPYEFDRAAQKREKATLLEHWGDWPACKAKLDRGHARSLVDYLVHHPTDFRGAVARLKPELQGLYLSAYQSHVWNRVLALWLTQTLSPDRLARIDLHHGHLPVPTSLPEELVAKWESLQLPLPSARLKPDVTAAWLPLTEAVLQDEGLALATMKIPGLQKPFFSKGDRKACVRPQNLEAKDDADDQNRGRRKVILRFELPRGSYATMLVKRVAQLHARPPEPAATSSPPVP